MAKDLAARIELGRSFHQEGTFNLKVCKSDFEPLWDGTIKQCLWSEFCDNIHQTNPAFCK